MQSDAGDSSSNTWWVVCLCAEWCGVCREWRDMFQQAAAAHPDVRFGWVDVEDEADVMGDVDIETFPTILIAKGASPRFFGPIQPSLAQLDRHLASLMDDAASPREIAAATPLLARLRTAVLLNL